MPMSDTDIIERLRWQKRYTHGIVPVTMEDAAKQIEQLRKALEEIVQKGSQDLCRGIAAEALRASHPTIAGQAAQRGVAWWDGFSRYLRLPF